MESVKMEETMRLKQPKREIEESMAIDDDEGENSQKSSRSDDGESISTRDEEEALILLIEHRNKEVQHNRIRYLYYKSQLEESERVLQETEAKLARIRRKASDRSSNSSPPSPKKVKVERRSVSPSQTDENPSHHQPLSKPQLIISNVNPRSSRANPVAETDHGVPSRQPDSPMEYTIDRSCTAPHQFGDIRPQVTDPKRNPKSSRANPVAETDHGVPSSQLDSPMEYTIDRSCTAPHQFGDIRPQVTDPKRNPKSSRANPVADTGAEISSSPSDSPINPLDGSHAATYEWEGSKSQAVGSKRMAELRECNELVPLVGSCSSPSMIHCNASTYISSQHKRKLRSLILCPVSDKLFITSALDGMVHFWQLQAKGSGATFLSSTSCLSPKQRRWPEDIAWHPEGDRLLAVYSADGGDNQISVTDLSKGQVDRVTFLEEKPHLKGMINSIAFMPWYDAHFATGGSDHAVVFWTKNDRGKMWKPDTLHRNQHSSAVMGVSGMQHKQIVLSVGADKRIIGYDMIAGRADYKRHIDTKCMSVNPNPCDANLFMVQTATMEMQLRLFDIRVKNSELHAFGWKQERSEQHSALITPAWSPNGLYISSGSVDPVVHIFDIRYNSSKPSQSLKAHDRRVFKAEWHKSLPLLITISSDLNIGLHRI